jgi:hypothetical protein
MKVMNSRLRASLLLLPLVLTTSAGCDIAMADYREQQTAEWRKSYELQPGGRVEIGNVNGKIEVAPGAGNTVEIYAKKIGKAASVEAAKAAIERIQIIESAEGGVIKVETKIDRSGGGMFNHSQGQVEYTVRMPANAELKVTTVNGGVELSGLTGRVSAEATNGAVRGRDIAAEIDASTTNGGVEMDLAAVPAGGVKLECTNGGIKLRLPTDARATIAARITNGGISTQGLSIQNRGEMSNRRLDADLNGGGPRISLEGTNGGIIIGAR